MGKIEFINITSNSNNKTCYINQAFLEKDKGIVNDRYYDCYKDKKEQVTFINLEEIDTFNNNIGKNVDYKDFRRNVIISGINLSKYINKKIIIQNVVLKIHELCQPCNYLQKKLGITNLVKMLVNKSGVRAEIISSGFISVGDKIKIY
ncbi:MAG: MOSC domain-containing protein [Alphaproteobacteria bacterium]